MRRHGEYQGQASTTETSTPNHHLGQKMAAGALAAGVFLGLGACGEKADSVKPTPGGGDVGTSQAAPEKGKYTGMGAESVLINQSCVDHGHGDQILFNLRAVGSVNNPERWQNNDYILTDKEEARGIQVMISEHGFPDKTDQASQVELGFKALKAAKNLPLVDGNLSDLPDTKILGYSDGVVCLYEKDKYQPNFN